MNIVENFINKQLKELEKEMDNIADEIAEIEVKKQSSTSITEMSADIPPKLKKRMFAIHIKISMLNQFSA